jgi:hypothetical protein
VRSTGRSDLLVRLSEEISALVTSETWQRYLECQSRFHRYSFSNVLLIVAQCPEASRVAGFKTWLKMGRHVRRGEEAIRILAPLMYRTAQEAEEERVLRGFKPVAVFDVSQTEGEELPAVCHRLLGRAPDGLFDSLVGVANGLGFAVEDASLPAGANGDCSHGLRRIRVEASNSSAQRVKTLAHELAHALLHEGCVDRRLAELEAESTAYVVCNALGLDTSAYSLGYVTTWAGGGDEAAAGIKASGQRIQNAASCLLDALEDCVDPGAALADEKHSERGTASARATIVGGGRVAHAESRIPQGVEEVLGMVGI